MIIDAITLRVKRVVTLGAGIHPARNDHKPVILTNNITPPARRRARTSYSTLRVRQTVYKLFQLLFRSWTLLLTSHCSLARTRTSPPAPPLRSLARILSIHIVHPGGIRLSHIVEGAQALVPVPNIQVSRNRFGKRIGGLDIKVVERREDSINALACEENTFIRGVVAQGEGKVRVIPWPVKRFRDANKLYKDRSGRRQ